MAKPEKMPTQQQRTYFFVGLGELHVAKLELDLANGFALPEIAQQASRHDDEFEPLSLLVRRIGRWLDAETLLAHEAKGRCAYLGKNGLAGQIMADFVRDGLVEASHIASCLSDDDPAYGRQPNEDGMLYSLVQAPELLHTPSTLLIEAPNP